MQYIKTSQGYLLRLSKGEEIAKNLIAFCQSQNILSGFFHAIGGVSEAELGYYDLGKKEYQFKKIITTHEIVSLTGNITHVDGNPFIHMHGVLSDEQYACVGGHVKEGVVGATFEAYIVDFGKEITRALDPEIGLKLLQCEIQQ